MCFSSKARAAPSTICSINNHQAPKTYQAQLRGLDTMACKTKHNEYRVRNQPVLTPTEGTVRENVVTNQIILQINVISALFMNGEVNGGMRINTTRTAPPLAGKNRFSGKKGIFELQYEC